MGARTLAGAKFVHDAFPAHHVSVFYPENRLRPQGTEVKQGGFFHFEGKVGRQKGIQE